MAITKVNWTTATDGGSLDAVGNVKIAAELSYPNHKLLQVIVKPLTPANSINILHLSAPRDVKMLATSFYNNCDRMNFPGFNRPLYYAGSPGRVPNFKAIPITSGRQAVIAEEKMGDLVLRLRADGTMFIPLRNSNISFMTYLEDSRTMVKVTAKSQEKLDKLIHEGSLGRTGLEKSLQILGRIFRLYSQACSLVLDPSQGGTRVSMPVSE